MCSMFYLIVLVADTDMWSYTLITRKVSKQCNEFCFNGPFHEICTNIKATIHFLKKFIFAWVLFGPGPKRTL